MFYVITECSAFTNFAFLTSPQRALRALLDPYVPTDQATIILQSRDLFRRSGGDELAPMLDVPIPDHDDLENESAHRARESDGARG